jgi:hypothetical protein
MPESHVRYYQVDYLACIRFILQVTTLLRRFRRFALYVIAEVNIHLDYRACREKFIS